MTIQLHAISDHVVYRQNLYNLLKKVEGRRYDSHLVKGVPHIGIGFKITEDPALGAVLLAFGINPNNSALTDAQRARESNYEKLIRQKVKQSFANDLALQSALDQIMHDRSVDSVYDQTFARQDRFLFNNNDNDAQLTGAFNNIIGVYEQRVHDWLGSSKMDADSNERTALVSMAYQGWINVRRSQSLKRAIINDDRAEAWYEIRYNTNAEARRILEADTFGLFNFGVNPLDPLTMSDVEAKAAFRMYTRHRDEINADEQKYVANNMLNTAMTWGNALGTPVLALQNELSGAASYLLGTYVYEKGIAGPLISWDHIYVGEDDDTTSGIDTRYYKGTDTDLLTGSPQSDLLFGESGTDILDGGSGTSADVLYGGAGADVLISAGGDDVLDGGTGRDVYVIGAGVGAVTIDDEDGLGRIVYEDAQGQQFALAGAWSTYGSNGSGSPGTYTSADGRIVYTLAGTTLAITLDGTQTLQVENYSTAAHTLGLRLTERTYPLERATLTEANADGGGGQVFDGTDGADRIHADPTPSGGSEINGQRGADLLYGGNEGDWLHGNDLAGTYLVAGGLGPDGYYVFTSHVGTGGLPEFDLNDHDILDAGSNRGRRPDGSYDVDKLFGDENLFNSDFFEKTSSDHTRKGAR